MAETYGLPLILLEYTFFDPHGDSIEKTTKSKILRFSLLSLFSIGSFLCLKELSNLSPIIHYLRSKPDPHLRNDVGSLPLGMDFI
jgi:hypothetical protein